MNTLSANLAFYCIGIHVYTALSVLRTRLHLFHSFVKKTKLFKQKRPLVILGCLLVNDTVFSFILMQCGEEML